VSDEAIQNLSSAKHWIASLALAMTVLELSWLFENRNRTCFRPPETEHSSHERQRYAGLYIKSAGSFSNEARRSPGRRFARPGYAFGYPRRGNTALRLASLRAKRSNP
jgi:hypothetical protein